MQFAVTRHPTNLKVRVELCETSDPDFLARHDESVQAAFTKLDASRDQVLKEVVDSDEAKAVDLWQSRLAEVEGKKAPLRAALEKHGHAEVASWDSGKAAPDPVKGLTPGKLLAQLDRQS
jgi:hypothetical protein